MASSDGSKSRFSSGLWKIKPPKVTANSLLYWYIPAVGEISYIVFSAHAFRRDILERLFPGHSPTVANCLLFNAHLGTGLYLYKRPHMAEASPYNRIMFSVYGALVFNFGSVLLWAITKAILPNSGIIRGLFCFGSTLCMLLIGKEYVGHIDQKFVKDKTA